MTTLQDNPTRYEALQFISAAASYGNLGLFIGAGLSKAVLNDVNEIALSWGQLLERASITLGVDFSAIRKEGASYPEIASRICQTYQTAKSVSFTQALRRLKGSIAELTCWYPDPETRESFGKYLDALSPAWIITTNYDLVIEALLTGRSIPLGPYDQLTSPRDVVPVYHLHGLRTNPEELIISQEDYVTLFRPNEYRQIKLALTVKESTTLILGYALGDVNVLTALDWSKNVFSEGKTKGKADYPHEVIQVIWKPTPHDKPSRDRNGILIIETRELAGFFEEYVQVRGLELTREKKETIALKELASQLAAPTTSTVERFIDDLAFRKEILTNLSQFPIHLIAGFISFLDKCIEETWRRAQPRNAFEAYDQNFSIILDILTAFDTESIPPALFQNAAYGLNRVAFFVGTKAGESWAAAATWNNRKGDLTKEMVSEMRNVATRHDLSQLSELLDSI